MLGQILITLIVILVAVIFLRRQRTRQQAADQSRQSDRPTNQHKDPWQNQKRQQTTAPLSADAPESMANTMKTALWLALAGILVIGSVITYLNWQDQQRLVTVLLYRDADQGPVIYRVSKRNLGDSSFITDDGIRVTVSANERMEIIGL